ELATRLILELCGGEASEVRVAGEAPAAPAAIAFDPAYVQKLSGLSLGQEQALEILTVLGFAISGSGHVLTVQPPTWRRDVEGKADLVEEVARIAGYDRLPATPLPELPRPPGGVLTSRQGRAAAARRVLASLGYAEAITWSFMPRALAERFGGGQPNLVLANPIAAELDCMRPSILPNLIEAAGRNANRGFADVALFEIGPVFTGDRPQDQRTAIAAVLAPHPPRRWDGGKADDLFALKADLMGLLDQLGAPVGSLQVAQGAAASWWHPGRSARLQLGPKAVLAEFGALHPAALAALDAEGPIYGFEIWLEVVPEPKRKAVKTRSALALSALMPLRRDFAFVVDAALPAADLVRAVASADKTLIDRVWVFDVYTGDGVAAGSKSLALEITLQPTDHTLTEAEIEALSVKIVATAEKVVGAKLRG
ncbi:MAG TPA: phenylalanine--tRNA ligase subunit beta, partial [Caulobacteraceae bacterium]|nr:phenylalanine--tRNA ligase subunit beta [Caulobacteraceae bacterium]